MHPNSASVSAMFPSRAAGCAQAGWKCDRQQKSKAKGEWSIQSKNQSRSQLRRVSPPPLLHHLHEVLEQIVRVMRAGAGLRVILHAEQRQIAMAQALERRVVQIYVRQLDFGLRQRVGIDGKIVIVRGNLDFAGAKLLHRMIAAVMPELELVGLATERDAGELVTETNAEDRLPPHEAADIVDRIGAWLGIAGAV